MTACSHPPQCHRFRCHRHTNHQSFRGRIKIFAVVRFFTVIAASVYPIQSFRKQACFVTLPSRRVSPRNNLSNAQGNLYIFRSPQASPLEDEPWKHDESYWDMLQQASKDPVTFEKFVAESMAMKKGNGKSNAEISSVTAPKSTFSSANGTDGAKQKKKGKYKPIEEWDAERRNKESMIKEERLQWECQQAGNQFRQNEILRHNLKSF